MLFVLIFCTTRVHGLDTVAVTVRETASPLNSSRIKYSPYCEGATSDIHVHDNE